jgi:hypothetical protein
VVLRETVRVLRRAGDCCSHDFWEGYFLDKEGGRVGMRWFVRMNEI